jgi:bifunctional non-homologous end joining protein LigD
LVSKAPEGDAWLHEVKIDGYRAAAVIAGGQVRMLSRNANDWTAKFDPLRHSLAKLKVKSAYLDGEVAVLSSESISDFGALQTALGRIRSGTLVFVVFDILEKDGKDLKALPLSERRDILQKLLAKAPADIQYSEHLVGQGPQFFRVACERGLEGIVSKRAPSPYRSGRGGDWVKVKCSLRQELVIAGYRYATNGSHDLESLLVGYYERGKLVYAGSVGTGWSMKLGRSIMAAVQRKRRDSSPFEAVPRADAKDARRAGPELVCEVQFTAWTKEGRVRHPSFKGMREDKPARDVKREESA